MADVQSATQQGTVGQNPAPGGSARWLWAGPEQTLLQTVVKWLVAQAWAVMLARRTMGSDRGAEEAGSQCGERQDREVWS